jgi:hypothetical protein
MKRFATMRDLIGDIDATLHPGEASHHGTIEDWRRIARDGQMTGKVVMVDRAYPHDPEDAQVMMLVASEAGFLVRVPLTPAEVKALTGFAEVEGR